MTLAISTFCRVAELIGDPSAWDGRPDPLSKLALVALHAII